MENNYKKSNIFADATSSIASKEKFEIIEKHKNMAEKHNEPEWKHLLDILNELKDNNIPLRYQIQMLIEREVYLKQIDLKKEFPLVLLKLNTLLKRFDEIDKDILPKKKKMNNFNYNYLQEYFNEWAKDKTIVNINFEVSQDKSGVIKLITKQYPDTREVENQDYSYELEVTYFDKENNYGI